MRDKVVANLHGCSIADWIFSIELQELGNYQWYTQFWVIVLEIKLDKAFNACKDKVWQGWWHMFCKFPWHHKEAHMGGMGIHTRGFLRISEEAQLGKQQKKYIWIFSEVGLPMKVTNIGAYFQKKPNVLTHCLIHTVGVSSCWHCPLLHCQQSIHCIFHKMQGFCWRGVLIIQFSLILTELIKAEFYDFMMFERYMLPTMIQGKRLACFGCVWWRSHAGDILLFKQCFDREKYPVFLSWILLEVQILGQK